MADVNVDEVAVQLKGKGVSILQVTYGQTVMQGQALYRKGSDQKYWLAENKAATAEPAQVAGIALTPGVADSAGLLLQSGPIGLGPSTLTVGRTYYLSDTPGGICLVADLATPTGQRVTSLGVATATDTLAVEVQISGVAYA